MLRPGWAPRQEVEDVVAEVGAVAAILGLDDRIVQELISLQPRRARAARRDPNLCPPAAPGKRGSLQRAT